MQKFHLICLFYLVLFSIRAYTLDILFRWLYRFYHLVHKKNRLPWSANSDALCDYPFGTLGQALGQFLKGQQLELLPRFEEHDVYHLLTGYATNIIGEIQLQYFLSGSGKRTPTVLAVKWIGRLVFPEFKALFYRSFEKGQHTLPFWKWTFEHLLNEPLEDLKDLIYRKNRDVGDLVLFI